MNIPDQYSKQIFTIFDNQDQTGVEIYPIKGWIGIKTRVSTILSAFMKLNPNIKIQSVGYGRSDYHEGEGLLIIINKNKR